MHGKRLIVTVCLAAIAVSCLPAGEVFAQSPAAPEVEEPIRMIVNYGEGKEKRRRSREGIMEPVGLAIGQQVGVTLQFFPKRAGELVVVRPLDGGEIDLEGPVPVRAEVKALQSVAEVKSLRHFRSSAEAENVIGAATNRHFEEYKISSNMLFDGMNSDGGRR